MQSLKTLIFLVITAASLHAAANRTFYVIGNPSAADLYDQYEQRMTPASKSRLPAPLPLEIIAASETMGDQITQGMRLSFSGTDYYLHLNDKGTPAGLPSDAAATVYRQCTRLYDTVSIAASGIVLSSRYPSGGRKLSLRKNERVLRIFTGRNTTFVQRLSASEETGWISGSGRWFEKPKKQPVKSVDEFNVLHQRIMKHLTAVNMRYDSVFAFFNNKTGQDRSVPYWEPAIAGTKHQYILRASPETVTQLSSSSVYVAGEIERILLGKPYSVSNRNGIITISPRTDR